MGFFNKSKRLSETDNRSNKGGYGSIAPAPAPSPTPSPNNSTEDQHKEPPKLALHTGEILRKDKQAFRAGSSEVVQAVLDQIEALAQEHVVKDGFNEFNFFLGLLNYFLAAFVFCAYPENFWIWYLAVACVIFPTKFVVLSRKKPLNCVLYLLDYCWIINMVGTVSMLMFLISGESVPESFREQFFLAAYGTAIGPLFASCIGLSFIAVIFHDIHAIAAVFIHFFPSLLFFNLRWKPEVVQNAWPKIFHLQHDIDFWPSGSFAGNVAGNTLLAYVIWYIPYVMWQYYVGLDLPRKNRHKKLPNGKSAPAAYDTVYHSTLRTGSWVTFGKLFNRSIEESKRQVADNDFELKDFVTYMALHFTALLVSICCLAYPCYLSPYLHGAFIVLIMMLCFWRGAKHYTYFSTTMYSSAIRKHFAGDVEDATLEA